MSRHIFISYNWNDSDDVNRLDNLFLRFQIQLTRDIRDLEYNANIHDFMDTIKLHDKLIIYVSDSYLRSVNCMYEASQAMSMKSKTVIIIKKGTKLFDPVDKMGLKNYWEERMQKISQMDPDDFQQEIDDTKVAYNCISAFIDFIKQDNRMNDEALDFDALLNILQVEKAYPNIITKSVYDWVSKCPRAKLFDVLEIINDLYNSNTIEISEFPNIPDNENDFLFKGIRFENEINGITMTLSITNKRSGIVNTIPYSHLVEIEENNIRSDHHAKYYFRCENPSKKQEWIELCNNSKYRDLNDEENMLLATGYTDTFRIIIHF